VTPRRILDVQRQIRDDIERQPSRFLNREMSAPSFNTTRVPVPRLRAAAAVVAPFLGARADDLVFVDNATSGANAVIRSFPLEPGDEILVTDLGYGAVTNAARFVARTAGATVRTVTMPHLPTAAGLAAAVEGAVGPRTRLAIVDHITAQSALVLPLADIAARLHEHGVAVLADGAHAPGAIALDVPALGVDWYVGNLHKWAWVPRSSGILWAAPNRQDGLHPVVISWGLDRGFTAEFDTPGTRDPSPHLSAPAALALFGEWGPDAIRRYNHELAWTGAHWLASKWQTPFETPEALVGTMATVEVPAQLGSSPEDAQRLRDALLVEEGIEVQMHEYRGAVRARISAQIYNDMTDIERLGEAVARRAAIA
jgi:isopenicillin-N epimerase